MADAGTGKSPDRDALVACFLHAVETVMPEAAMRRALEREDVRSSPIVVAAGKAAVPMAGTAMAFLQAHGLAPSGGLVIAPAAADVPGLPSIQAEHPVPGPGSRRAAEALDAVAHAAPPGADVWFLLSGGATSLMGGPDTGVDPGDLDTVWRLLLTSGIDIRAMNAVRKRLTRWGGGKLARALSHTQVLQLIVSDVIGNDLASIGSGPLAPDPVSASEVVDALRAAGLWAALPTAIRHLLDAQARGARADTPGPGDPAFRQVRSEVIVSNEAAVQAAADWGERAGWQVEVVRSPLEGEASDVGQRIAQTLMDRSPGLRPHLVVQGGETTVAISGPAGLGGRAQELALAAARVLAPAPPPSPVLLAAGTDGRDGPTDAAGAVVDGQTWSRAATAGAAPGTALATHDAYHALDAAGALLRPGPTGTNVMDLVLGLVPARGQVV